MGAEEVEDNVLASCLSFLRSHPTPCLCDEPRGSSLLSSEGAGTDGEEDVVASNGGRVEDGRSRQQIRRDNADALSLVLLLSASILRVPDELPGLSLWSSKGERSDVETVGRWRGRVEEGSSGQQITRDDVDVSPLMPLLSASVLRVHDKLFSSLLLCSESARRRAGCMRRRDSQGAQGWVAEHEGQR